MPYSVQCKHWNKKAHSYWVDRPLKSIIYMIIHSPLYTLLILYTLLPHVISIFLFFFCFLLEPPPPATTGPGTNDLFSHFQAKWRTTTEATGAHRSHCSQGQEHGRQAESQRTVAREKEVNNEAHFPMCSLCYAWFGRRRSFLSILSCIEESRSMHTGTQTTPLADISIIIYYYLFFSLSFFLFFYSLIIFLDSQLPKKWRMHLKENLTFLFINLLLFNSYFVCWNYIEE